jgi:hypothetical protein
VVTQRDPDTFAATFAKTHNVRSENCLRATAALVHPDLCRSTVEPSAVQFIVEDIVSCPTSSTLGRFHELRCPCAMSVGRRWSAARGGTNANGHGPVKMSRAVAANLGSGSNATLSGMNMSPL